jgi:hypothetical protein
MSTLKNWIMLCLFAVNISACGAEDIDWQSKQDNKERAAVTKC